jgi:putative hemolysin
MIIYLIIVLILLFLSAILSGSETALVTFTKTMRAKIREDTHYTIKNPHVLARMNIIDTLLDNPSYLLATILFSNLLVNTTASSLFTLFAVDFAKNYHLSRDLFITIGALVMTVLLVSIGEIAPKVIALRQPSRFALQTTWLVNIFSKTFSFITIPLQRLGDWLLRKLDKYVRKTPYPSEDDLRTIIELSSQQNLIKPDEKDFLFNLVDLSLRRVTEIMTPRIDMVCLEKNIRIKDAINLLITRRLSMVSRIPVYKEKIDNIIGILYLKDLVTKSRSRNFLSHTVEDIMRPAYFVPENKSLSELIEELRKKDSHIAIVIDEFGQTAGLITLEDILEVLLGEIQDEYDISSELPYERLKDNSYLVSGDIDLKALDQFFPNFSIDLPQEAGYRLSGFIHHTWGRIPRLNETLTYKNYQLQIKEKSRHRIEKILITKIDPMEKMKR